MKITIQLIVLFCLLGTLQAFPQFQNKTKNDVSAFEKNRENAIGVRPHGEQNSSKPLTDVKLDSILSFKWDTATHIWIPWKKEYRTYNTTGYPVLVLFLISNNTGGFRNYQKHTTEFTETGMLSKDTWYGWDQVTSGWVITAYQEYNDNSRLLNNYYYIYDDTGNRILAGGQMNYLYDTFWNNTEIINQNWDTASSSWINYNHSVNTYNANLLIEHLAQIWNNDSSQWRNNYDELYTYDINNRQVDYSIAYWNDSFQSWQNIFKKTNVYDSLQSLKYIDQYQWNNTTMVWDTSGRYSFSYTQTGNLGHEYYMTYDTSANVFDSSYHYSWLYYHNGGMDSQSGEFNNWITGTWTLNYYLHNDSSYHQLESYNKYYDPSTCLFTGGYRLSAEYDSTGNEILYQYQQWNLLSSGWDNMSRSLMTYDSTGLIQQETDQDWGWTSGVWVNNTLYSYYYNKPAGIEEPGKEPSVCLFNNPLTLGQEIHCTLLTDNKNYRFSLYSTTGSLVYTHDFRGNTTWIFDGHLATGMYLMTVSEEGKILYTGKVIVR
ncbi:MAG: T9SS type A sorting domain-containing protein [Bacteroidetes bacterium]|nr:T9SS type A sorting domain-containing protein [Bacteroidota bacterium]